MHPTTKQNLKEHTVRSEKMFHEPAEFNKKLEENEGFIRSNIKNKHCYLVNLWTKC